MFYFKVSTAPDITMPLVPGATLAPHDYLGPIPAPPGPPVYQLTGLAMATLTNIFWPPGMALGQNQVTTQTLHRSLPVAQAGHDVGVMVPHVQLLPGPTNAMTALHIAFSSRKSIFPCPTVLVDGKPVTACTMINAPPAPMLECGDPVSTPTATSPTSHMNTVLFGMKPSQYWISVVKTAAIMLVELAFAAVPVGKKVAGKMGEKGLRKAVRESVQESVESIGARFGKELAGKLVPTDKAAWAQHGIKQGIGVASGVARMETSEGPAAAKVGVGSPYLKQEVGVSRDADGNWSVSESGRAGTFHGKTSYHTTEGKVTKEWGQSGPTGDEKVTFDSDPSEGEEMVDTSSSHHSVNPTSWGEPL